MSTDFDGAHDPKIRSSTRLTQRQLRAINEALAARLADEIDDSTLDETGVTADDYEQAKAKIEGRIKWKPGEV